MLSNEVLTACQSNNCAQPRRGQAVPLSRHSVAETPGHGPEGDLGLGGHQGTDLGYTERGKVPTPPRRPGSTPASHHLCHSRESQHLCVQPLQSPLTLPNFEHFSLNLDILSVPVLGLEFDILQRERIQQMWTRLSNSFPPL